MSDEVVVRYMSRAVISVDRVEFNPADNTLTIYDRKDSPDDFCEPPITDPYDGGGVGAGG